MTITSHERASKGYPRCAVWRGFLKEVMTKLVSGRMAEVAGCQGWKGISAKGIACAKDEMDEF